MSKSPPSTLTEEDILNAPESDYMNSDQLEFFRQRLLELHETTSARIQETKDEMVSPMDFSDPSDRATSEEESNIALRILEREQRLLRKIKQSLERIRSGEYGYCLESGDEIGIARLLARPTAEYSAEVKRLKEIKEQQYKD